MPRGRVTLLEDSAWSLAQEIDREVEEGVERAIISVPHTPSFSALQLLNPSASDPLSSTTNQSLHPEAGERCGSRGGRFKKRSRPRIESGRQEKGKHVRSPGLRGHGLKEPVLLTTPTRRLPPACENPVQVVDTLPEIGTHGGQGGPADKRASSKQWKEQPELMTAKDSEARGKQSEIGLCLVEEVASTRAHSHSPVRFRDTEGRDCFGPNMMRVDKDSGSVSMEAEDLQPRYGEGHSTRLRGRASLLRKSSKAGHIIIEGELQMRETFSMGLKTRWVMHWVILDQDQILKIYSSQPQHVSTVPKFVLRLNQVQEVQIPQESMDFSVLAQDREPVHFKALSLESRKSWASVLLRELDTTGSFESNQLNMAHSEGDSRQRDVSLCPKSEVVRRVYTKDKGIMVATPTEQSTTAVDDPIARHMGLAPLADSLEDEAMESFLNADSKSGKVSSSFISRLLRGTVPGSSGAASSFHSGALSPVSSESSISSPVNSRASGLMELGDLDLREAGKSPPLSFVRGKLKKSADTTSENMAP